MKLRAWYVRTIYNATYAGFTFIKSCSNVTVKTCIAVTILQTSQRYEEMHVIGIAQCQLAATLQRRTFPDVTPSAETGTRIYPPS